MNRKALYVIVAILLIAGWFVAPVSRQLSVKEIWSGATYTQDMEFGNGSKKLIVEVEAADKTVVFTLHTDKETLGEALTEHYLISGEVGQYGMYVKHVNGIMADYSTNHRYWAFTKNGEYVSTGVDKTEFADGDKFEFVYSK